MKKGFVTLIALLLVAALVGCAPSKPADAPNNQPQLKTKEEAKTIALNDAKVDVANVTDLEVDLDEENGVYYFEVDFDHDGSEYDYKIDAISGKILHQNVVKPTGGDAPQPPPADKQKIGIEAAKKAAFDHAKVKEADVKDLDVDLDEENGKLYYDVSFDAGGKEYDYHVDAYSGEVHLHEVEKDDDQKPAEKPADKPAEKPAEKKKIGVAAAKSAALKHANVKQADARDLEADLDNENGKLVYEVSFEAGGYDYDYDIDAYSGKVIRSEKDRED